MLTAHCARLRSAAVSTLADA